MEVSADLVSTVTDSVLEYVIEWQHRPLEPMYPVVFFDALRVKIRDEGSVRNKAVYLALGIRRDGREPCVISLLLSTPMAMLLPLRWLAILHGRLLHRFMYACSELSSDAYT